MDNRILYGILTILFNHLGVPCFMQGKTKTGIIRLVLCVVTFGIVGIINFIKGIIVGIKVLKMSDEEFAACDKVSLLDGIPAYKEEQQA